MCWQLNLMILFLSFVAIMFTEGWLKLFLFVSAFTYATTLMFMLQGPIAGMLMLIFAMLVFIFLVILFKE